MADAEVIANVPKSNGELVAAGCDAGLCGGIRYDAATLSEIHRVALDRFLAIPRGGLEVGGVLFGRIKDDVVEILAAEDFAIEYLSGPSFALSERDEAGLAERLQRSAPESDGDALQVVGWWHSHTRSEVAITAEDIRVHAKFFPKADQVALIIKPFKFDPARIAVYRPGGLHGDCPCIAFSVGGRSQPALPPVPEPLTTTDSAIVAPVTHVPVVLPRRRELQPRRRSGLRRFAIAAGTVMSVLLLIAFAYSLSLKRTPEPPKETLALNLSGVGNELTIQWEDSSNRLASSKSAELIIVDGADARRIPLSIDSLRSATLAYARRNPKVEVRLRAWTRDNQLLEAVAHYVGPVKPPIEVTPPPVPPSNVEEMKAELDRLNSELLRMRNAEPPSRVVPPQIASTPSKPVVRTAGVPISRARQEVQAQPTFVAPPSIATSGIASPPVQIPIQSGAPPPPAPPKAPAQTPAAKLSSGRAIWTGVLPRGGVLLFDGRRPSAGTITGRLPQRRSRVRVFPADLTPAGIVVYTDGSKQQIEPPGAANGWNLTMYRADARRSRDVTVVEAPSQSNNWQKLMVRSEQRPISMLVVEWEEIP